MDRSYHKPKKCRKRHVGSDRIKYDNGVYDTDYFSKVNVLQYDTPSNENNQQVLEKRLEIENIETITKIKQCLDDNLKTKHTAIEQKEARRKTDAIVSSFGSNSSEINNQEIKIMSNYEKQIKEDYMNNEESELLLRVTDSFNDEEYPAKKTYDCNESLFEIQLECSNEEIKSFQKTHTKQGISFVLISI